MCPYTEYDSIRSGSLDIASRVAKYEDEDQREANNVLMEAAALHIQRLQRLCLFGGPCLFTTCPTLVIWTYCSRTQAIARRSCS